MSKSNAVSEQWLREVTTPLGQSRVPCRQCGLNDLCDTLEPSPDDRSFVQRGRLGSGQLLFSAGEPFHGVYAVTSGAIKTYAALDNDQEQVVDFHFPGDTVGLDAVDRGAYTYAARALSETLVCRIDVANVHVTDERFREFQSEMIRAMGEQLRHEQSLSILLRKQNAEQRIATFLLSLAGPSVWAGAQSVDLKLPMSRKDIANYLGVAVETLCRLFKRLQDEGLISSQGRQVGLLNIPALSALARPAERKAAEACAL
ncbi:MAG: helix-turn-helix domain-containing protein [Gammaproteobacteria bacterium]|nr:helix-turn-helix domain-containing protein [Gammaproteobacteria bacterium]MBU2478174.1 helix-turn-helix domain-containing protein [Gammaproteobacteria bacterium]